MTFSEFAERYIFVRKCAGCGELLGYDERRDAFCPVCRIRWERAKAESCNVCHQSMVECGCMPKKLSKTGLITLMKLIPYRTAEVQRPENRVIYFLKHNKNKRVNRFIADQLSYRLKELLSDMGKRPDDMVLTYIPRSKRAIAKYGFDQAELICCELGEIMGIKVIPMLNRLKKGSEQKKLTASARSKNTEGLFGVNYDAVDGLDGERSVIIFDDIVTSGASMAEATRLLRKAGFKNIYGLCVAYTL